ncbi:MAG: hypothetical protein ACTSYL_09070 [Candidatus Thorarchaeota archaeon]
MVIRIKDTVIKSISSTETKRLKLVKISSKTEGAELSIELPDALCDMIRSKDHISVIIDDKPIPKGESARFYAQGRIFKIITEKKFQVVGSIGGLRMVLTLEKPTPSQKQTLESQTYHLALI